MLQDREQAVRDRAYAIWEQDGRPEGRSLAHWSQAEAEIGAKAEAIVLDNRKPSKSRHTRAVNRSVTTPGGQMG
jgi:aspartyl/asparaginyl beta-hydroxylase (cupin superfamily)